QNRPDTLVTVVHGLASSGAALSASAGTARRRTLFFSVSIRPMGVSADLDRNAEFARKNFNLELTTFSFPFGDISLSSKRLVQRRFDAPSSLPGVNRGVADLG